MENTNKVQCMECWEYVSPEKVAYDEFLPEENHRETLCVDCADAIPDSQCAVDPDAEPMESTCVKCDTSTHTIFEDGECGYCKDSHKETLEREHMGDFDKKTGIYAQPVPRLVNSRKLGSKKE